MAWPRVRNYALPLLPAVLLTALVASVFSGVLDFEFIDYDTPAQVIENPLIRDLSPAGLARIFSSRSINSYYPVRTLSYAVDYRLWGLWPGGFKLTNLLIHTANALLVYLLALRILGIAGAGAAGSGKPGWLFGACDRTEKSPPPSGNVPAAALAAAIWAIHPVIVEPVVWVPGREELLMTLGMLACVHFHLTARRSSGLRAATFEILAVAAALTAVFSNAAAAAIPLIVLAWDRILPGRPSWRRTILAAAPLAAVGLATIVVKKLDPEGYRYSQESAALGLDRWQLVFEVYWLNLRSLVWPSGLSVDYPVIDPATSDLAGVLLGAMAAIATLAAVAMARRQPGLLSGAVWFLLALAPASQILPHHIQRADRFLYCPMIGLAIVLAVVGQAIDCNLAGATRTRRWRLLPILAGVTLLLLLNLASHRQLATWKDSRSVWTQAVQVGPGNALAWASLADALERQQAYDAAAEHYEHALTIDPGNYEVMRRLAIFLVTRQPPERRDSARALELARVAWALCEGRDATVARALATTATIRANEVYSSSRFAEAIGLYDEAIAAEPGYAVAKLNAAVVLATCRDERLRQPERAILLADEASQAFDYRDALSLGVLAQALASAGRFEEAAARALEAARLAEAEGDPSGAARHQAAAAAYSGHTPPQPTP